jgi:hypothetical protein
MVLTKRGLSDVVTTVLMILLSLAAVVIIWTFVQSFITSSTENASSQAACIGVTAEAVSCSISTGVATVQLTGAGTASASDIKLTAVLRNATGSTVETKSDIAVNGVNSPVDAKFTVTNIVSGTNVVVSAVVDGSQCNTVSQPINCE